MNIAIYTECPTEFYFRNLRELEKSKLIKIKIYDSRIARTAYHNPFRAIKHLFNPIRLLFHKKIIINFAPYSWAVFYFLILKLLKKDLIFFTSWPYWEENVKVPRVRFPFDRKLWKIFLKNIKIVVLNNETKLALEKFEEIWGCKYQYAIKSWKNNWKRLSTFFKYPDEIRKIIYTTNAIENLNRNLRKVTKNKSSFPTDDSLFKILYLIISDLSEKWQSIRDWNQMVTQFGVYFGERVTKYYQ